VGDTVTTPSRSTVERIRHVLDRRREGDSGGAGRRRWVRRLPLLPAFVYVIIVTQVPFIATIWYSFRSWNLLIPGSNRFTGLRSYQEVFADPTFLIAVINTVELTASAVIIAMLVGIGLAILLNREFFGRAVVRTLLITPFLVMPVASALLWKTTMYDPLYGLLDFVLSPFGIHHVAWLSTFPMPAIVTILAWEWAPFMMLIVLAGLQSESLEVLEAAKVDGASTVQTFTRLTFPHIRPYVQLGVLLGSVYIIQAFGEIFMDTAGGPGTATTNLPYYLYEQVFNAYNVGVGAAAGVIVLIGTEIVAIFALRLVSSLIAGTAMIG
jgi:sorbitol/mannitol transport system permease protein